MLHYQMIGIGRNMLGRIMGMFSIALPAMLELAIIFAAVFAASLVSFYWFEKPANKWVKRMLGNGKTRKDAVQDRRKL
jgi:peptidoglycan/LPS O-acetylase OafA/YrhL